MVTMSEDPGMIKGYVVPTFVYLILFLGFRNMLASVMILVQRLSQDSFSRIQLLHRYEIFNLHFLNVYHIDILLIFMILNYENKVNQDLI